jgi:hypothetical protein
MRPMFRCRLTSRSIRSRLRVAAISFACLFAQMSALAHQMLVPHAKCAEHGDSVHVVLDGVVDRALHGALGAFQNDGADARQPVVAGGSVVDAAEHGHCSVAGFRNATIRFLHGPVLVPDAGGVSSNDRRDADSGPAVAPYVLAPKTSPPHRST